MSNLFYKGIAVSEINFMNASADANYPTKICLKNGASVLVDGEWHENVAKVEDLRKQYEVSRTKAVKERVEILKQALKMLREVSAEIKSDINAEMDQLKEGHDE